MRSSVELHISRMWDVFSSPIEGVVWDSGRHCWIAQPVLENVAPHYFAPAVLGMEGAKSEAIKQRRVMEAEAGLEVSVSSRASDQPKQVAVSAQAPARHGGNTPAAEEHQSQACTRLQNHRSPNARTPPVRSPPRVQSRTQSPQQSRSPVPSAGNTQRLPPRTNSAPRVARVAQPRQSANRITYVSHDKVVGGSSRENSPAVRDLRQGTSPAREVPRRTYSPLTGRREAEIKQPQRPRENARRHDVAADERRRPRESTRDRALPKQVMMQLQELQSKVAEMQEEASRERSEKEALRRTNERLQLQVDKLLKVASIRIGRLDEADAIAEIEGSYDSRVLASLRPSCSSANDTDSVASSGIAAQDVHPLVATFLRTSQSRDSCETESLASSVAGQVTQSRTPPNKGDQEEESVTDSAVTSTNTSIEAPVRSAVKKKQSSDHVVAGRSLSLGDSRNISTPKTGSGGVCVGRARPNVARSCDALRREPEVADALGSPSRTPGSPNRSLSGRVAASSLVGRCSNGFSAPHG